MLSPVLALAGTVMALQQTLVVPLLPAFPEILGISPGDASWLVTAALLAGGVSMPVLGRMADLYGKRRLMLVAISFLAVGSMVALVWTSFSGLIVARAMQGVSMAVIPIGMSVLKDHLSGPRLGRSIALMSATMGIGGALGMPLSGLIFQLSGWQGIFGVTALAGAALAAGVGAVVPRSAPPGRSRFDGPGAALLAVAVTSLLLAISKAADWGWGAAMMATVMTGTAATIILVPRELRTRSPILDLRVATRGKVMAANLFAICSGFTMFASMLLVIQQLQLPVSTGYSFGLDPLTAGLCMVPGGLAMTLLSPATGALITRFGPEPVLVTAGLLMAAGYSSLLVFNGSILAVILGLSVVSVATALAFAAQPTIIMAAVPAEDTAAANGLNSLMRSVGTSLASAVTGAALAASVLPQGSATGYPAWSAFEDIYVTGICVGAASACLAALTAPRRRTSPAGDAPDG